MTDLQNTTITNQQVFDIFMASDMSTSVTCNVLQQKGLLITPRSLNKPLKQLVAERKKFKKNLKRDSKKLEMLMMSSFRFPESSPCSQRSKPVKNHDGLEKDCVDIKSCVTRCNWIWRSAAILTRC